MKFIFDSQLHKFVVMPNGLTSGPRIFTKLMKPVLAFLRKLEIILAIYIDDIINIHRSLKACGENTQTIIQTLKRLGFIINTGKSIKTPSKIIEFLGFEINSEQMTIKLTMDNMRVILEAYASWRCVRTFSASNL